MLDLMSITVDVLLTVLLRTHASPSLESLLTHKMSILITLRI